MPNHDSSQFADSGRRIKNEEVIDLKKLFNLIITHWYYFFITMVIALICAFLFNKYTIPVYKVSATLLINEDQGGVAVGNDQIFEGFGLEVGVQNLDNQMMVLTSKTLINRAFDELGSNIEYYQKGLFRKIALYPYSPIAIVPENADSIPKDVVFKLKNLDNNMFSLEAESKGAFRIDTLSSFGSLIKFPGGSFSVEQQGNEWVGDIKKQKIFFINHDRKKLVESFRKRLKVEPASKNGTIVNISLEGTNKLMDMDFLENLTEIFINNSLDKKNQEAIRTIQFIDDQLIGISDSLIITENKLQQFRSSHRVMDLSAQGQVIIDQAMSLENEKARLGIEANYFNYLADYLEKDNVGQAPIAPATMGITDPGLTRLVSDLTDLQSQLYSKSMGEKNPLQAQLTQRVRNTKGALKETLNGVRRANNLAMNEIDEQIRTVNAQAAALPVTERQLLGIERKYKLNDELYTFLLEKRAGAQIQKASNIPDNEIIDPAEAFVLPVKPNKPLIYVFALFSGIFFPFFWILIAEYFSNKVKGDEDINLIGYFPIVGHIPHCSHDKNTVVFEDQSSQVAEAFRSLRSRIQVLTSNANGSVILITSSIPEEGKTFIAINLASVFSLMGKKTVLVGFDLRKPNIYADFGIGNDQGVSTWLIGKAGFQDIIKETKYHNLSVIPAGPIPQNPAELIALEKTVELLRLLREKYEYIIIDSSPIGTVSDAFQLSLLADVSMLIVRQNMTYKGLFENTAKELKNRKINNTYVVVNDIGSEYKQYVYGGQYTSHYGKNK